MIFITDNSPNLRTRFLPFQVFLLKLIIFIQIYSTHRLDPNSAIIRVDLGVMETKSYSKLPRAPEVGASLQNVVKCNTLDYYLSLVKVIGKTIIIIMMRVFHVSFNW